MSDIDLDIIAKMSLDASSQNRVFDGLRIGLQDTVDKAFRASAKTFEKEMTAAFNRFVKNMGDKTKRVLIEAISEAHREIRDANKRTLKGLQGALELDSDKSKEVTEEAIRDADRMAIKGLRDALELDSDKSMEITEESIRDANRATLKELRDALETDSDKSKEVSKVEHGSAKSLGLGVVTAGILLADALKRAASESKILTTVITQLFKALGLLMDLILMPFLPLLIIALVNLYEAIDLFGKAWEAMVPAVPGEDATAMDWAKWIAEFEVFLMTIFSPVGFASKLGMIFADTLKSLMMKAGELVSESAKKMWDGFWVSFFKALTVAEQLWKDLDLAGKMEFVVNTILDAITGFLFSVRSTILVLVNFLISKVNDILALIGQKGIPLIKDPGNPNMSYTESAKAGASFGDTLKKPFISKSSPAIPEQSITVNVNGNIYDDAAKFISGGINFAQRSIFGGSGG